MLFHEKFDFLMRLTSTSNALISQKTNFDPSYISRLRNGKRNPIKDVSVIREMAGHFARQCTNPHHLELMDDIVGEGYSDDSLEQRADRIETWLYAEHHTSGWEKLVEKARKGSASDTPGEKRTEQQAKNSPEIYHGIEGKMAATERLLSEMLSCPYPVQMSILSDESMSWMTADPLNRSRLNKAISAVLEAGHSVLSIHRIDRDLDEMLAAISQWLPYYSTGRVQSYYYPRTRDGLYQRTLFIASGIGAMSSGSVNGQIEHSVSLYTAEEESIAAFEKEFQQVLALCRPLANRLHCGNGHGYIEHLKRFDENPSHSFIKSQSLSIATMPESLVDSICAREQNAESWLPKLYAKMRNALMRSLASHTYHEIIPIQSKAALDEGRVPLVASNILHTHPLYYTKVEYVEHLEHILELIDLHERFHVTVRSEIQPVPYTLHVKKEHGAMLTNHSVPPVVLTVTEGNITASLHEYLEILTDTRHRAMVDDEQEKENLARYIESIR